MLEAEWNTEFMALRMVRLVAAYHVTFANAMKTLCQSNKTQNGLAQWPDAIFNEHPNSKCTYSAQVMLDLATNACG